MKPHQVLASFIALTVGLPVASMCAAESADVAENNAAQWGTFASDGKMASVADSSVRTKDGSASLLFTTESGYDTGLKFPASPTLNFDAASFDTLVFWEYAENTNPGNWQGSQPIIVIQTTGGSIRLAPTTQQIANFAWRAVKAPLSGGEGWTRTTTGTPNLAHVTQIEIHHDTWGAGFRIWLDGMRFMNLDPNGLPPAGPVPPAGVDPDIIRAKVLLYVMDPILENAGGRRTHEVYGWQDPVALANQIRQDFLTSSHGRANFEIVETVVADEHPLCVDGFRHTDETFVRDWAARIFHDSQFDYVNFCNAHRIGERVDAGEIDEVWIYSSPFGRTWESCMAGKGAYWINGQPYPAAGRERAFVIMGLNYERGVSEAIHSWGHRAESIMVHSYGQWQANRNTTWNRFALLDKDAPGLGGVGNVHFPVNGAADYDYANTRFVSSNADAWLSYPNLNETTRSINFHEWSPSGTDAGREYLNWWYAHMPHAPGRGPDYYLANWWRYLIDVDQFKNSDGKLFRTIGRPSVQLTLPVTASVLTKGTPTTMRADASVDGALGRVDFYVDGVYKGTDYLSPYAFTWSPQGSEIGTHIITARAYELQNGTETISEPVSVTVVEPFPGLSSLVPSAGALAPAFSTTTTSYAVTVSNATNSMTVTPTTADAGASIKVNTATVISGTASDPISLNVGSNTITTMVTAPDGITTKTYTLDVTRAQPAPEIAVEQPAGTSLVNGAANVSIGNVKAGSDSSIVTFTIRNTGAGDLTGLAITKNGANAAEFTVSPPGSATLAPNASTTFTVMLSPTGAGARSAAIHIASNDADENPFDITLTGMGLPVMPGTLAIGGAMFSVDEEAGTVNIPITRTGGTDGAVSVLISTSNGTATAGSDYTAVTNQLVSFADRDGATKNVPITILNPAGTNELTETFSVVISIPTGGATLGNQKTATVVIIDSGDTTKPGTPTITAPPANAKLSVNPGGTVTVSGTATDNQRVASVEVSLDNWATFTPATVTPTGAGAAFGTTATYTVNLLPVSGASNTVLVRTADMRGNVSTTASRTFTVLRPLSVTIAGPGSVTAGFAASSFREIGKSYSISATPAAAAAPGFAFNRWTVSGGPTLSQIGVTAGALELPTLTFVFREGLVLTADFIPNPFASSVTGAFNGLIMPSVTLPAPGVSLPSNETVGKVTATVTGTGALSGRLLIDGMSLGFAGTFDNTGTARFGTNRATTFSVVRTTKPSYDLTLHLDLAPAGTNKMTGTLTQKIRNTIKSVSTLDADRAFYNGATVKVPANLAGTGNKAYTVSFPAKDLGSQPAGFTLADYPQGDGYATASVNINGTVSVVGKLADGTAITASAPLSKTNTWPLFQQLYPVVGVTKGSIAGQITLDDTQAESDMAGTNLRWFRPFQLVQWYPYGWDEGILVDLMGAKFVVSPATPATSVFPGPGPDSALKAVESVNGNVGLAFSDGLLTGPISRSVNISTTNVATKPTSNTDANFTLTLTKASGIVTGTFTHTDGTKPAFQGVIIQKGAQRGAYGYFLTKQPAVIDYTGESGGVSIVSQP